MKILNTTYHAIDKAAHTNGFRAEIDRLNPSRGGGYTFRVKLYPGPFTEQRKVNPYTERRANALCWHGFRDFFRTLFSTTPDAKIRSALASWNGSEDFELNHRDSGHQMAGSLMFPYALCEACDCPDSGHTW